MDGVVQLTGVVRVGIIHRLSLLDRRIVLPLRIVKATVLGVGGGKYHIHLKETKKEETRRFSVRHWSALNEENRKKGRPTIKLEEGENDLVSAYYFKL